MYLTKYTKLIIFQRDSTLSKADSTPKYPVPGQQFKVMEKYGRIFK